MVYREVKGGGVLIDNKKARGGQNERGAIWIEPLSIEGIMVKNNCIFYNIKTILSLFIFYYE